MNTPSHSGNKNVVTADGVAELQEALETLYVFENMSGRQQFTKDYPVAAQYIFSQKLVEMDTQGTTDPSARIRHEHDAEARRALLVEILQTLEEKSVDNHVLQKDYINGLVHQIGGALVAMIYKEEILERAMGAPSVDSEPQAPTE